jgi:adenine C2-methylase RlmN of 23S rRNA A2503 and tRNA A37
MVPRHSAIPDTTTADCFLHKPRGLDVYAACGQLKRMELVPLPSG